MMRVLVTLLLAAMITSGALALECYPRMYNYTLREYIFSKCTDSCSSTTTTVDTYIISGVAGLTIKAVDYDFSCGSPDVCMNSSINIGVVKIANHTQCCSTRICNNKTLSEMPKQPINGRRCYTCNDNDCSDKLHCEGEENHCITATVAQGDRLMTLKGCTTKNVCNTSLLRAHGLIITDVECCEGSLCNHGSITQSFIFMVILLFSSILFY